MKGLRTIETRQELENELRRLQTNIKKAQGLQSVDLTQKIDVVLFKLSNRENQ